MNDHQNVKCPDIRNIKKTTLLLKYKILF